MPASGHIKRRLSKIHAKSNRVLFVLRPTTIEKDRRDKKKNDRANKYAGIGRRTVKNKTTIRGKSLLESWGTTFLPD